MDKKPTEPGQPISGAELEAALAAPGSFPGFLRRYRLSTKFQRLADEHYAQVHQDARMAIVAVESSPKREEVISALRKSTGIEKGGTLADLVLTELIEYGKKDASARSCDKGVQAYLARRNVSAEETAAKIKLLGGIQATYKVYRDENRKSAPPPQKRSSPLSKAAVRKACPKGGWLLTMLQADKSGGVEIVHYRPMAVIAPTIWAALAKAASEAEAAVNAAKRPA